jgi:hypothetical protein
VLRFESDSGVLRRGFVIGFVDIIEELLGALTRMKCRRTAADADMRLAFRIIDTMNIVLDYAQQHSTGCSLVLQS